MHLIVSSCYETVIGTDKFSKCKWSLSRYCVVHCLFFTSLYVLCAVSRTLITKKPQTCCKWLTGLPFTLTLFISVKFCGCGFSLYCIFQHGLMTQLLRLAHNCLTFDFIGTSTDESSDDLCTVQIPTSWRPAFLDFSTLKLFFDLYHSLPNTLSPLVSQIMLMVFFRAFQVVKHFVYT